MSEWALPEPALEEQVGKWLLRRGLKLVAAESCTGGLIGHRITDVPGSSAYFLGSIVSYAYEAKQCWLGVRAETLAREGAVSRAVAQEMAHGARTALAETCPLEKLVSVAVTGVAGPGGGTPEKPVGLVWIAISAPGFEQAEQYIWSGSRAENKQFSADQAFRLLLEYLQAGEKSL